MHSWTIENLLMKNAKLFAEVNVKEELDYLKELKAEGQILVDSDKKMFVYLLGDQEGFVHLRFPSEVWSTLDIERKKETPVHLLLIKGEKKVELELIGFWSELTSLLDNIQGNRNYGDEMVETVETMFKL